MRLLVLKETIILEGIEGICRNFRTCASKISIRYVQLHQRPLSLKHECCEDLCILCAVINSAVRAVEIQNQTH